MKYHSFYRFHLHRWIWLLLFLTGSNFHVAAGMEHRKKPKDSLAQTHTAEQHFINLELPLIQPGALL
jgi:hypothetical protein